MSQLTRVRHCDPPRFTDLSSEIGEREERTISGTGFGFYAAAFPLLPDLAGVCLGAFIFWEPAIRSMWPHAMVAIAFPHAFLRWPQYQTHACMQLYKAPGGRTAGGARAGLLCRRPFVRETHGSHRDLAINKQEEMN